MWVFGYGSLMWDGWEAGFGGSRREKATLPGYQRDFNKASVKNWGTTAIPGPTLGLAPGDAGCVGFAFEFPDEARSKILGELRRREGASFSLEARTVIHASGQDVAAFVPVNNPSAETFIGDRPLDERARLARVAQGTNGRCRDYVANIRRKLVEIDVHDPAVESFWTLVSTE